MIKIGITGSISSGKTTTSKIISKNKGPLFSADKAVKKLYSNKVLRKTIAKRLSESKFSAPHYYLEVEFNMDNLISFRIQHNNSIDSKISFNDIIIKAAAKALIIHPEVNAKWSDDKIVQFKHVHMGVAWNIFFLNCFDISSNMDDFLLWFILRRYHPEDNLF